ncbi:protein import receptor MAS20 [Rhizoclosmatium globosum]|uniref:Protein import receptor MAS20 n=1 Tax=Rhizoclosmatium globosum TaxID=329046 RepID=A0A1Y2BXA7_9FUNG|nr:TOMM20-like protein 1 [Rhizoclosmatium sp. JEL0117]ORY39393.1 protein import receptor MAS20 [Rhizoclosmatium globosum]|eukprot:ORY39393.1 protein import receptor MAS20 [Rhizoclosmatium globosum]
MVTTSQVLLGAGLFLAGYAVYFDQRRQRDPEFRRRLRADRQAAQKLQEQDRLKADSQADAAVKAAMEALGMNDDKVPTTEAEKQTYLTRQLQLGEQFLNQGPAHYKAAATCLFRALQVYPDPLKLLMAFQETVPPQVLDMVMQMMAQEGPKKPEEEKIQEILD